MYNHNFYGAVFTVRWNLMFSERLKLENPKNFESVHIS